jgi:multisubunit Na+/H+ antiporter MnhB subunit
VTVDLALDAGLGLVVLAVALWTVATRDAFAAVVGFVAFGLLLAVAWMRLAAPDVALTEAAIGSGLTGGLLVGAVARLRGGEGAVEPERPGAGVLAAAGGLCVLVTGGLAAVVLMLPDPAPSLAGKAQTSIAATGLGNPVTAVLMAYRAIDTLLEVVVLLLALIGVWSLAPNLAWGGRPRSQPGGDRGGVLEFLGRLLPPVGIVVGIHIFWIGSDAPGGEFQGATILAAMWVLTMMAGLARPPAIGRRGLRLLLVVGPAVFLAVGLAGFAVGGAFLGYPEAWAKPLILAIEIPLTLSIAAILALLIAGPSEQAAAR